MKKLLNTLFVNTQGAYIRRDGETILVQAEDQNIMRVPIHTLDGIICFGRVSCSPYAMQLCGERKVNISFLSPSGRFLGRVVGPVQGNVLLRRQQYRLADQPEARALIAQSVIAAKIVNSRTVIMRALRDHPENPGAEQLKNAAQRMRYILNPLKTKNNIDTMRGIEGDTSRTYFSIFDHLITAQKDDFIFNGRNRRPPLDKTNSLLSFLYAILAHDITSALQSVGLDPAVGYLHSERPGRPALALDIMEELRAFLADRLALTLINLRQVDPKGFKTTESGAVIMDDDTRKTILTAWQRRKQENITHPFIGETCAIGVIPHIQALLLARHIRGDMETYPPFISK